MSISANPFWFFCFLLLELYLNESDDLSDGGVEMF